MKIKSYPFLIILVVLAMVVVPASARPAQPELADTEIVFKAAEATLASTPKVSKTVLNEVKIASELGLYTILLREAPLASYDGSLSNLKAANPSSSGQAKLDAHSSASLAYRNYLADKQALFIKSLETEFDRTIHVKHTYQVVLNGFAAELTPGEAAEIAQRNDVRLVERNGFNQIDTDAGPSWIGAPGIWDGTNTGGSSGTKGEGVIVGILDTGINSDHPSFAATGPHDSYVHQNPLGSGNYLGVCDPDDLSYDASFVCNDKLIGAWEFAYDSANPSLDYPTPEDENGHGSHTASTAAGNIVNATLIAPTTDISRLISGVAPHANIIAYDVCNNSGCPFVATTAAVEQAVLDGVDVINYSISGGEDPYNETTDLAFLEAYNAGIFISTSAGNDGPESETVAHRGPWVSASAAATHHRTLRNTLTGLTSDDASLPNITGLGFTSGYGPAPILYAGNYGDALCAPGATYSINFDGAIVVCDRGIYARLDKAKTVAAAGAGGFVLANDSASGNSLSGDAYAIPGVHITYNDGVALKAWMASNTNPVGTITGFSENLEPANGDIMAAFSSRGPNSTFDVLKPDLTTPGVDIWAAIHTPDPNNPGDDEYGYISGTSMASPHTAGAAALITALHPSWSSAEILSALMMTAERNVLRENGITSADWFDMGAGRVDLNRAAETGLVLDETYENFLHADPTLGGDVKTLNTPSLTNSLCLQNCDWTRTFTSVADTDVEWTITSSGEVPVNAEPDVFTITAGSTQEVVFTADVSALTLGEWAFGMVTLTPNAPIPTLNIPVSVAPTSGFLPSQVTINTRRDVGSQLIPDIQSIAASELTIEAFGLAKGVLTQKLLPQDSDNFTPYDDPTDGAFSVMVNVAAGTNRMVAEITASSALDIDMFIGLDDGDGIPEEGEEICKSTTSTAIERCDLLAPTPGTYWVLIQNWSSSEIGAMDDVTLSMGVVPDNDAENMIIEGPASTIEVTPYDLTLYYDITKSMEGDRWYGAFNLGSTSATPGNIGFIPVDIIRHADDVVKSGPASAAIGETISYTIDVAQNVTPVDLTYTINDTIPAGLTLDPSSISVTAGSFEVTGSQIVWTVSMPSPKETYNITTSIEDPSCDTGFTGYVNLEGYGINSQSNISGDTLLYTAFSSQNPFHHFGQSYTGMGFSDDGFVIFDSVNHYAGKPWTPQTLPDATLPNNLLAMLWQDMKIEYNSSSNYGISLATSGPDVSIIEYDNAMTYSDSSNQYDFEIVAHSGRDDTPGRYEYVFAYDNLNGALTGPLTIGAENASGTTGVALVNNADASILLQDGLMICLDAVSVGKAASMTYDVAVDVGSIQRLTNTAVTTVDNPGSTATSDSWTLKLDLGYLEIFLPIINKP